MSTWQPGRYRTFRATTKIHLGKYEMDIFQDDEFEYDGYTIRYASMEYTVPQLQGLENKWFVPSEDRTTTYKARPAGVIVNHATPEARERGDGFEMEEASSEEALVSTVDEQKQVLKASLDGNQDRLAALRQIRAERKFSLGVLPEADSNPDAPPPTNADDVDPDVENLLMADAQEQQEQQPRRYAQARPVHSSDVRGEGISRDEQAAVARAERINMARIQERTAELERLDPRKSRDELATKLSSESGNATHSVGHKGKYSVVEDTTGVPLAKEYRFSEGAAVGANIVAAGAVKATNVEHAPRSQPVQVGRAVATTPMNREAGALVIDDPASQFEPQAARTKGKTQISRKDHVGIDEVGPSGATGDVQEAHTGDDLASLLPDAAVAGRTHSRPVPPPPASEDDEIAFIVESWSTRRNWQTRVDEAVSYYGDWPAAIDAICDVESPKVAEQIRSRLARQEGAKT